MTWSLRLARAEVAAQVKAKGINAIGHLPARINPPVVLVAAGDPYVDELQTKSFKDEADAYGAKALIRLELTVVSGVGDNEVTQNSLDDLICTTLNAVRNWDIERVSQPYQLEANNALYLSARIIMTAELKLEEVI